MKEINVILKIKPIKNIESALFQYDRIFAPLKWF